MQTKEELLKIISDKLKEAEILISECQKISEENKIPLMILPNLISYDHWESLGYNNDWMPSTQDC